MHLVNQVEGEKKHQSHSLYSELKSGNKMQFREGRPKSKFFRLVEQQWIKSYIFIPNYIPFPPNISLLWSHSLCNVETQFITKSQITCENFTFLKFSRENIIRPKSMHTQSLYVPVCVPYAISVGSKNLVSHCDLKLRKKYYAIWESTYVAVI